MTNKLTSLSAVRRPYVPPRLIVYGSVQNVTAGGMGQVADGEGSTFLT